MKFKLVEDFDRGLETLLSVDTLNEGYELLWKQFEQLFDIKTSKYELHHIYNDVSSKDGKHLNFLLLPQTIHRRFPRNNMNNRDDAIKVYKYLKTRYPEGFTPVQVTFQIFTPEDITSVGDEMTDINRRRRNSRRNKYKKDSIDDILKQTAESEKELTTV